MLRLVFPIAVLFQYVSTFFPLRNNVPLESGDKYSFNEDGSEMTILDVTKLDEGDYTCIAKNKAGESEQELSLKVFGKNTWEMKSHRSLEIWQHSVEVQTENSAMTKK